MKRPHPTAWNHRQAFHHQFVSASNLISVRWGIAIRFPVRSQFALDRDLLAGTLHPLNTPSLYESLDCSSMNCCKACKVRNWIWGDYAECFESVQCSCGRIHSRSSWLLRCSLEVINKRCATHICKVDD